MFVGYMQYFLWCDVYICCDYLCYILIYIYVCVSYICLNCLLNRIVCCIDCMCVNSMNEILYG
jgi:hypothetical protein